MRAGQTFLKSVGPGTGVDTWIASFRTKRPIVVIGINPLEVANTKATARISGFEVRAIVGDNVADEKGNSRLSGLLKPGGKALLWNIASFVDGKDIIAEILETADTKRKVLDVEVELFAKRRQPKPVYYNERLYTVSPALAPRDLDKKGAGAFGPGSFFTA